MSIWYLNYGEKIQIQKFKPQIPKDISRNNEAIIS